MCVCISYATLSVYFWTIKVNNLGSFWTSIIGSFLRSQFELLVIACFNIRFWNNTQRFSQTQCSHYSGIWSNVNFVISIPISIIYWQKDRFIRHFWITCKIHWFDEQENLNWNPSNTKTYLVRIDWDHIQLNGYYPSLWCSVYVYLNYLRCLLYGGNNTYSSVTSARTISGRYTCRS